MVEASQASKMFIPVFPIQLRKTSFRYGKLRVGKLLLMDIIRRATVEPLVVMAPVSSAIIQVLIVLLVVLIVLLVILIVLLVIFVILLMVLEVMVVLEVVVVGSIRTVHPSTLTIEGVVFTVWISRQRLLALLVIGRTTWSLFVVIRVVMIL